MIELHRGWRIGAALALAAAAGGLALYAALRLAAPEAAPPPVAPASPGMARGQSRIRVAPLAFATTRQQAAGTARALDLSPLAAIAAEVADNPAGSARREQACRRVTAEYGPGLARLGCGKLAELARDAAAGQLAVLWLDTPSAPLHAGAAVTLDLAPGSTLVRVLGPAAARSGRPGALAVLRGDGAARLGTGRQITAHIPAGAVQAGLLVPPEAVVRVDGAPFAWRALGADTYERVPLEGAVAQANGWFVPAGEWKAGDRVVVAGTDILRALEHGAADPVPRLPPALETRAAPR